MHHPHMHHDLSVETIHHHVHMVILMFYLYIKPSFLGGLGTRLNISVDRALLALSSIQQKQLDDYEFFYMFYPHFTIENVDKA